jgi:glyoxylase-like metal-dependent hydrolase (beta-lactamase superfamily II)
MSGWAYEKGLHDLGNGTYGYLLPDGSWGWSNAGLIVDGDQSLLVDTLFDAPLTREMLSTMSDAAGVSGESINTLVNTHANGDHTHGNGLCSHAEIIASEASAKEMAGFGAEQMHALLQAADGLGDVGAYVKEIFGPFDFGDVAEKLPTRTFSDTLQLKVGDRAVELIEVGPAHTLGDVLVAVDGGRTIYTGDILFVNGTPIMWAGPVSNWIAACELIIGRNPEVVVPGHGPITDVAGVSRVKEYLAYIDAEARNRFDAGLSVRDAAFDIALADYGAWSDSERIAVNVAALYKEYGGDDAPLDTMALFGLMAELRKNGYR